MKSFTQLYKTVNLFEEYKIEGGEILREIATAFNFKMKTSLTILILLLRYALAIDKTANECSYYFLCKRDLEKFYGKIGDISPIKLIFWTLLASSAVFLVCFLVVLYNLFSNNYAERRALEREGQVFGRWTKKKFKSKQTDEDERPPSLLLPIQRRTSYHEPVLHQIHIPPEYPMSRTNLLPQPLSHNVKVTVEKRFCEGVTFYFNKKEMVVHQNEIISPDGEINIEQIQDQLDEDTESLTSLAFTIPPSSPPVEYDQFHTIDSIRTSKSLIPKSIKRIAKNVAARIENNALSNSLSTHSVVDIVHETADKK